jgi:hypothetical protein
MTQRSNGRSHRYLCTEHDFSLSAVFSYLDFAERFAVRFTCVYLAAWSRRPKLPDGSNNDFGSEVNAHITAGEYAENGVGFMGILKFFKARIIGSTLPQILYRVRWVASDLDICCMPTSPQTPQTPLSLVSCESSTDPDVVIRQPDLVRIQADEKVAVSSDKKVAVSSDNELFETDLTRRFAARLHALWQEEDARKNDNLICVLSDPMTYGRFARKPEIKRPSYRSVEETDRYHGGYHTHESQRYNAFAHERLSDCYSLFPLNTIRLKRVPAIEPVRMSRTTSTSTETNASERDLESPGKIISHQMETEQTRCKAGVVELSVVGAPYKSVEQFLERCNDFAFCCMTWDGERLRVRDWNAVWTRRCTVQIRNIALRVPPCLYSEEPTDIELRMELLVRIHGRRAKYERRGNFRIDIEDELAVLNQALTVTIPTQHNKLGVRKLPRLIDVDRSGLPPWPRHAHDAGTGGDHDRVEFVSRSPVTQSLYVSPYAAFPWHVPPIPEHVKFPTANLSTHTPFPLQLFTQWRVTKTMRKKAKLRARVFSSNRI